MSEHYCRVCGLYIQDLPWGEDGSSPTYEICACCGVEFGYEDSTLESIRKYRKEWIDGGAVWFESSEKPPSWNLAKQLKNVPSMFL